jgi:hypothetical protein
MANETAVRAAVVTLLLLVALAVTLAWYFTQSSGSSASNGNFYFAGYHAESDSSIRAKVVASPLADSAQIVMEGKMTASTYLRMEYNIAGANSYRSAFFYNSNDGTNKWQCIDYITFSASVADLFHSAAATGQTIDFSQTSEGLLMAVKLQAENGSVILPIKLANGEVVNFGGFAKTAFSRDPSQFTSFITTDTPSASSCTRKVAASQGVSAMNLFRNQLQSAQQADCNSISSIRTYIMSQIYYDQPQVQWVCPAGGYLFPQGLSCGGGSNYEKADTTKQQCSWSWSSWSNVCTNVVVSTDRSMICGGKRRLQDGSFAYESYIVFSGTDDLTDAIEDIKIWPSWMPEIGMNVHSGFLNKYNVWRNRNILSLLPRTTTVNKNGETLKSNVVFMGHSLGGAIANVAATMFKQSHSGLDVAIVTMGTPAAFSGSSVASSSLYNGIPNHRYINYQNGFWCSRYQDPVSDIDNVIDLKFPANGIVYGQHDTGSGWQKVGKLPSSSPFCWPFALSLHSGSVYTAGSDACRAGPCPGSNCEQDNY